MAKERASEYELTLGGNMIRNCGKTIVFEGKNTDHEVARLRVGDDAKVLLNCKVIDERGNTVASVHNSRVMHVAPGFEHDESETRWLIRKRDTGETYFELEYSGTKKLKLNGRFWIEGNKIVATDDGLSINDGVLIKGCTFDSCGAAIGFRRRGD